MRYEYSDTTQLSPHFNVSEFRCKCGREHEILINPELVSKLEILYDMLNCSRITINSGHRCSTRDKNVGGTVQVSTSTAMQQILYATVWTDSRSAASSFVARRRTSVLAVLQTLQSYIRLPMWT